MMNHNIAVHIHNVKFGLKHKTKTISKHEHLLKIVPDRPVVCIFNVSVPRDFLPIILPRKLDNLQRNFSRNFLVNHPVKNQQS